MNDEIIEQAVNTTKERWRTDPKLILDRNEVLEKFGKIFKLENIDNLTEVQLQEFLSYKNNHHWRNIERRGGHLIKDMGKLRNGLKILLDESRPLSERIRDIRDRQSKNLTKNLGMSIYSIILFMAYPEKYPVINAIVAESLHELGLYDIKKWSDDDEWVTLPEMQEIVYSYAKKYKFDLWQIDWIWWEISNKLKSTNNRKTPETNEITPSDNSSDKTLLNYLQNMQMQANYKPIVIKILIEKGIENNYTASNQEIRNQIELLNFDRKDFSSNNVDASVYRALEPYVISDATTASLEYKFTSDDERKQCLKVCGQKIVQWHIEMLR